MHKKTTKIVTALMAAAMVAPMAVSMAPMVASAGQICGESKFTHKALPWHTCESSPAKQDFKIEDGTFHIKIITAAGVDNQWDLQFRHRKLDFYSGHTYTVSFRAKASRNGLKINSKIGDTGEPYHEYCDLTKDGFVNGPHMDNGKWGEAVELSTEWKEFKGTFKCSEDLKAKEWAFHYAAGEKGNAEDGDEIWFDDMSIIDETSDDHDPDPLEGYGAVNRFYAGYETEYDNIYISANQIGYYTNREKIATLGDNAGDIIYHGDEEPEKLSLSGTYTFELVNKSGDVKYTGTTSAPKMDPDSKDNCCTIDFTEFNTPGEYYLRIKGKEWRSFPFYIGDNIYSDDTHDMLTNAMNYFYQNRSGLNIEEAYITSGDKSTLAHKGGHTKDQAAVQKIWKNEYKDESEATGTYASSTIEADGGWYDAGDHGKYVVNGGISVWTLQNMYERAIQTEAGKKKFADKSGTVVIPEAGNGTPDVLDECAYEIDFMSQMVVDKSEPTWGKYAGMVYHKLHDHKWTGLATRPWDYEKEWKTTRIVKPPTFAATLNYAACAAQAARLWKDYDATKSAKYLEEAKKSYKAAQDNYYPADMKEVKHDTLDTTCPAEELNEKSLYAPMWHAKGGGPYGDNEVRDDFYWAACELFISASELGDSDAATYLSDLSDYKVSDGHEAFKVTTRITGGENASGEGSFTSFNWGNTASAGSLALYLHRDLLTDAQKKTLEDSIKAAAQDYIDEEAKQGYGIPYTYDGPGYNDPNNLDPSIIIKGYEWGSNSMVINNLIVMAYAYDLTGDGKYMDGVLTGMDYLLGRNPLAFSYITGYGTYHEKNPHHRYWSYELDDTLPMAPDGVLSGGPNAGLQDPYVRALGFVPGEDDNPSQRCYVDSIEAWSTNEVTINWNAPLAWIVSFLQDEAASTKPVTTTTEPKPTTTTTTTVTTTTLPGDADWGNVNCSEGSTPEARVDVSDAVLLAKFLGSDSSAKITDQGKKNGNVIKGDLDDNDLTAILKFIAKLIKYDQFPLDKLPS
ncbi:MAG: glycoside hydrolase family 9 protein [Oscillospiraceae bacterium]|nr:glycoside hydrolase family 9 protein [Oscillospiraceae bacterium]